MIRHSIVEDIMNDIQAKFKDVPDKYKDPVTHALLDEPAYLYWSADGSRDKLWKEKVFEMHQIKHWFEIGRTTNPANDAPMGYPGPYKVEPAAELKEEIRQWKSEHADLIHDGKNGKSKNAGASKLKKVLVLTSEDEDDQHKEDLQKQFKEKGFDQVHTHNYETPQEFIDDPEMEKYDAIYDLGLLPKAYRSEQMIGDFWSKIERMFVNSGSEFIASNKLDPKAIQFGHDKVCAAQHLSCHKLKVESVVGLGQGASMTKWRMTSEL